MLYDISGIRAGWAKINKGMLKMYNAEVLSKFPVVQHFRFGSLFCFDPDPNAPPPPASVHAANQPVRDGSASSAAEKVAAPRATPSQAPWASQATTSVPSPNTAAPWANPTLNPAIGTAAPWATRPSTMLDPEESTTAPQSRPSSKGTPSSAVESGTVAPWTSRQPPAKKLSPAGSRGAGIVHSGTRILPKTANDDATATAANTQTMPSPTRAPWAKPP